MATDEAYQAAEDALFHANELWPSFTTNPLAQSLGGPREARLRTAKVAVDAVWDLAVAEGRRQAAEAIEAHAQKHAPKDGNEAQRRLRRHLGIAARVAAGPMTHEEVAQALGEWAARIAAGETP